MGSKRVSTCLHGKQVCDAVEVGKAGGAKQIEQGGAKQIEHAGGAKQIEEQGGTDIFIYVAIKHLIGSQIC